MLTLQIEELISFGALSCVWLADRMYEAQDTFIRWPDRLTGETIIMIAKGLINRVGCIVKFLLLRS